MAKRISTISEGSTAIDDDVTISSISPVSPVSPRRTESFHYPSPNPTPTARRSVASTPRPAADDSDITHPSPYRKFKYYNPRTHRLLLARGLGLKILGNVVFMAGLCMCLYGFSTISDLNVRNGWYKRVFNFLSILLIALIILGIGSMLNKIGSMVRWPLLARRSHRLDDVFSHGSSTQIFNAEKGKGRRPTAICITLISLQSCFPSPQKATDFTYHLYFGDVCFCICRCTNECCILWIRVQYQR